MYSVNGGALSHFSSSVYIFILIKNPFPLFALLRGHS